MKIIIASDIHGSASYAKKLVDIVSKEQVDRLVLLGDLLYHGARNHLPDGYQTMEVYSLLNSIKDIIVATRGNCDSEVDQLVLEFPMFDDYKILEVDGIKWFLTHGHINDKLPEMGKEDILFNGHSHVYELTRNYINPGSVGLPKENPEHTYVLYDNKVFTLFDFDGNELDTLSI